MIKVMDKRDRERLWKLMKPCTEARRDAYLTRKDFMPYPGTNEAVSYFDEWAASQEAFLIEMRKIHDEEKAIFGAFVPAYDLVDILTE